jgi:hypothetical protein
VGELGICPFYLCDPEVALVKGCEHTCYCARLLRVLAANEEHDVPLAGIDVVVLQEEYLVYAIFLQRTELDEKTNSSSQSLFNDQVLLASDLRGISWLRLMGGSAGSLTYSFQQVEQIPPSLVCYFLGVYCPDG